MKYYELDEEEKEILQAYNQGKMKPLPSLKQEKIRLRAIAKATLDKTKNINIRISEADLLKIKAKALEKGLPYQTLISSIIHQNAK